MTAHVLSMQAEAVGMVHRLLDKFTLRLLSSPGKAEGPHAVVPELCVELPKGPGWAYHRREPASVERILNAILALPAPAHQMPVKHLTWRSNGPYRIVRRALIQIDQVEVTAIRGNRCRMQTSGRLGLEDDSLCLEWGPGYSRSISVTRRPSRVGSRFGATGSDIDAVLHHLGKHFSPSVPLQAYSPDQARVTTETPVMIPVPRRLRKGDERLMVEAAVGVNIILAVTPLHLSSNLPVDTTHLPEAQRKASPPMDKITTRIFGIETDLSGPEPRFRVKGDIHGTHYQVVNKSF